MQYVDTISHRSLECLWGVAMRIKLILLLTCLIMSVMFLTGCDSYLDAKGRVVEWVGAPNIEKGSVYIVNVSKQKTADIHINEYPPKGSNLQPAASATISFFYESGGEKYIPIRGLPPSPEKNTVISNSQGYFEESWVIGAGNTNMKIIAEKDGYYTVERIFPFQGADPGTFDFTVVLVRKP